MIPRDGRGKKWAITIGHELASRDLVYNMKIIVHTYI